MLKKGIFFIFTLTIIFFTLALFSFDPHDSHSIVTQVNLVPTNWLGNIGAVVSSQIFILMGRSSYFLILFLALGYFSFFSKLLAEKRGKRLLGLFIAIFSLSVITVINSGDQSFQGGGLIAGILDSIVRKGFGLFGEVVLLTGLIVSSIFLIFDISIEKATGFGKDTIDSYQEIKNQWKETQDQEFSKPPLFQKVIVTSWEDSYYVNPSNTTLDKKDANYEHYETYKEESDITYKEESDITYEEEGDDDIQIILHKKSNDDSPFQKKNDYNIKPSYEIKNRYANKWNIPHQTDEPADDKGSSQQQAILDEIITHDTRSYRDDTVVQRDHDSGADGVELDVNDYIENECSIEMPLTDGQNSEVPVEDSPDMLLEERKIVQKLESTLREFGIEAKVVNISRGPAITRYEVLPAPGIRVSKIVGLQDNLALSLAASKIRVEAPIPGKSAVGIEIPNKNRLTVTLYELLNSDEYKNQKHNLPIALGKDISGKTVIADLVSMPHLLIAGSTGAGKSVFVNSLICSLLYFTTPAEVRFLMIDPKRVELKLYDEIPHLIAPVLTDPKKAVVALKWAVTEMEERYKLLEKYNCRDMKSYNKKVIISKANHPNIIVDAPLEYIIIIIDEFADLMLVSGKEVEGTVARLAAMSRAVGIHLVLATQRPSVDVITGLIKANFPARISFQVSSKTESRIILDSNGADKLLGKGDLLFSSPGLENILRIQAAYLSDEEVSELTTHLKSLAPPNYIQELEDIDKDENNSQGFTPEDEPLFNEAVQIILADRKASASYLQRRMRIGYNRAARLIELLEKEGIVAPAQGAKPREILIESF